MRRARPGNVIVLTTHKPIEHRLVVDYLLAHGLDVTARGERDGALIGAGQHIFELTIEVPQGDLVYARELIEKMRATEDADEEELRDDGEPEQRSDAPRLRWMMVVWLVFFIPGGGHWYARRPWTAALIAATELFMWVRGGSMHSRAVLVAAPILVMAYMYDLVGGIRAVRAYRPEVKTPIWRQLLAPLVALGVAVPIGVALPYIMQSLAPYYGFHQDVAATFEAIRRAHDAPSLDRFELGDGVRSMLRGPNLDTYP